MTNPIRDIIQSRLLALRNRSDALESISHDETRGGIREDYLAGFFADVIPSHLRIKKGLICDSRGRTTKQTDFIVYDPAILPALVLSGNVGMLPIESVFMQAEIKSVIRTEHLDQIDAQIKALHALAIAHKGPSTVADNIIVPTVLFGYGNEVSVETLKAWIGDLDSRPNLVAICVVGGPSLFRIGPQNVKVVQADEGDRFGPTLQFVHKIYETLWDVATKRRDFVADWSQYLRPGPS